MEVKLHYGKNHLHIIVRDKDDVEILKAFFDNVIAKATECIAIPPPINKA